MGRVWLTGVGWRCFRPFHGAAPGSAAVWRAVYRSAGRCLWVGGAGLEVFWVGFVASWRPLGTPYIPWDIDVLVRALCLGVSTCGFLDLCPVWVPLTDGR